MVRPATSEFQRIARKKGWTLVEIGERWGLSERAMSRKASAGKQIDLDAVNGLPVKGEPIWDLWDDQHDKPAR